MTHPRRHNDQIATLHHWLKSLGVPLASKTETRAPWNDPEHLMRCGVEVGLAVHAIYPLRNNLAYCFQVFLELCGCGIEGSMVYHERLWLDRSVRYMIPLRNLTSGHLNVWQWSYGHNDSLFGIAFARRKGVWIELDHPGIHLLQVTSFIVGQSI